MGEEVGDASVVPFRLHRTYVHLPQSQSGKNRIVVNNISQRLKVFSTLSDGYTGPTVIKAISPAEGFIQGNQTVVIVGENFFPGMEVNFGSVPAYSKFLTNNAIEVVTPARPNEGEVDVTLTFRTTLLTGKAASSKFMYQASNTPSLEYCIDRLRKSVRRRHGDPEHLTVEEVMDRAAEMLEAVVHPKRPPFNEVYGSAAYQGASQYEDQRDDYQRYVLTNRN